MFGVIKREIGYVIYVDSNVQDLKEQDGKLEDARERVQHSVDRTIRNAEKIEADVLKWLANVDKKLTENIGKKLKQDEEKAKKNCFFALCPNIKSRYQVGRKRTRALEGIMEDLNESSARMVGIHGMAGVGKTTLAKEVAARKLDFEEVGISFEDEAAKGSSIAGCKILLTSRGRDVLCLMHVEKSFKVEILSQDESMIVFAKTVGDTFGDYERRANELLQRSNPSDIEGMQNNEYSTIDFGLDLLEGIYTLEEARKIINALVHKLKASSLLLEGKGYEWVKMHDLIRDVSISIASKNKGMWIIRDANHLKELLKKGNLKESQTLFKGMNKLKVLSVTAIIENRKKLDFFSRLHRPSRFIVSKTGNAFSVANPMDMEGNISLDQPQFLFNEKAMLPLLEELDIKHLDNLEMLWPNQHSFSKITSIKLFGCPSLRSIPTINWSSLKEIEVGYCEKVEILFASSGKSSQQPLFWVNEYSKFDFGQYPDFDLGQYSDFDDVMEEETDHACNDFDIGQYPNFDNKTVAAEEDVVDDNEEEVTTVNEHVEHPFCNSYNPEEEKEEEEVPEEKKKKKMPLEYARITSDTLQIPEEELVKIAFDCYTKVIRIKKDDCFDTKEDLKIDLYTKCVEDDYQLKVNKSSKDRFETRGSPEASFAQLPAYCHNLKLKNPGSVTHSKTDRDGSFELLFIAIGAAIRSFITCMRPVIIVDGAHLKGRYLGVNLLAVAIDANNGILPIASGLANLKRLIHGHGTLERRVTPWTEKKITKHVVKSTSWRVEPCSNTLFEVLDNNLNGLIDLNAKTCSCKKWKTSGYPCGHVIKVAIHLNQYDSSAYAMDCYTIEVYRKTYAEIVYPCPHPSEWDIPDDLQTVLPPVMDSRLPGRPKNHDRIPSKGEEKRISTCSRCKESGHTRLTCGSSVPSQSSFPLPKNGSSSKSKAHMVPSKKGNQNRNQNQNLNHNRLHLLGLINLGDF
ncbi:hypothetical protein F3Y22_tig00111772pilonHSYRG00366 [Hibiscus syriacus]|uniref:SWIM-type domain-containing protein n=1 Tax=Hibiscus syriacus TaxID=106335 RepID=A0A6A2XDU5_HIBSY|nr:hypothetical protein F3Y22_tig00111772pilonHSYRG00366 [Hibiscus syriacus]